MNLSTNEHYEEYEDDMERDYENFLNSVDCFDTVNKTWISVAHLNHARLSPGLVVINGSLIAVGWDKDRTIEEYNVINNTWTVREERLEKGIPLNGACVMKMNV